jgi:glutamate-5-semialdehyde dehydrogenase
MDINYMEQLGQQARKAARHGPCRHAQRNRALTLIADAIERDADPARRQPAGHGRRCRQRAGPAMLDRLACPDKAIATMVEGLRQIVALPDPIGEISA